MHQRKYKKRYLFAGVVLAFVACNALLFWVGQEKVVDVIGIENSYLIVFLVSAIGGLSTFTGAVYVTTITTFAAGGADPLLLGLAGGIGLYISDSFFFYLARLGKQVVPKNWIKWVSQVEQKVQSLPGWASSVFVYIYVGFTPLPNDILMIGLVIGGYTYKRIAPALLLGSVTQAVVLAHIGQLF